MIPRSAVAFPKRQIGMDARVVDITPGDLRKM